MKCVVKMEEIPDALIINWDQTAMKIVPSSSWTMEKRGTKRVEIVAIDDKRQDEYVNYFDQRKHRWD